MVCEHECYGEWIISLDNQSVARPSFREASHCGLQADGTGQPTKPTFKHVRITVGYTLIQSQTLTKSQPPNMCVISFSTHINPTGRSNTCIHIHIALCFYAIVHPTVRGCHLGLSKYMPETAKKNRRRLLKPWLLCHQKPSK